MFVSIVVIFDHVWTQTYIIGIYSVDWHLRKKDIKKMICLGIIFHAISFKASRP